MKKYNFLNIWRLIMALLVIAIHLQPFDNFIFKNNFLNNLYNFIIQFAVPFFFLSTGFLIGKKIDNISIMKKNDTEIIKNYIFKSIKLYILFTIIYLPITIYGFIQNNISLIPSTFIFLRNVLFIGENFNSWILWYLLSEIYALILIYFFIRKIRNNNDICLGGGILLFLLSIFIDYFNKLHLETNFIIFIQKIMKNIVPNGRIFYASLYIPIGIYISKNEKFKKNKISILALIILIVLNTCFNNILLEKISLVICSYIVFKIIITIDVKCEKLAKYCKHASKDFYFWHMYVYSILLLLNEKNITNTHNYIYYILTIIILFIITTFNYFIKNF